jgi:hypothetical protein
MIRRFVSRLVPGAFAFVAFSVVAAPHVLSGAQGGLWQVAGGRRPPTQICVSDPLTLASYEHLGANCRQHLVRGDTGYAVVGYECAGGAFGQSSILALTPRSLRIETQGISGQQPYNYVVSARRLGDCQHH